VTEINRQLKLVDTIINKNMFKRCFQLFLREKGKR